MMTKTCKRSLQSCLVPPRIALRSKEDGALVIVHAVHSPALIMEESTYLRTDQSRRARYQNLFHVLISSELRDGYSFSLPTQPYMPSFL